ncbi:MAG TPA: M23 family metallopeptidase [Candidatus Omnitrophota bacterium]|nr:M23 family metallopeptidase [Candidatus Omnitrophota bacterium]
MKLFYVIVLTLSLTGCATSHYHQPYRAPETYAPTPALSAKTPLGLIPSTDFSWPLRGNIVSYFQEASGDFRNKGIDINGIEGECVKASESGKVVYSDTRMRGFGMTIIIDHGADTQTVYAYNSELLVKTGDRIKKGDPIAKVGSTGRAKTPTLHFEIRKNGEPVDPLKYLR